MPDFRTLFAVAQRASRINRCHPAHIAQSGTISTRDRCIRDGRLALLCVINTKCRAGKLPMTALRRDFCQTRSENRSELHVQYVSIPIRPFWRFKTLPQRGMV
jgi:hypothetical protein